MAKSKISSNNKRIGFCLLTLFASLASILNLEPSNNISSGLFIELTEII